MIKIKIIPYCKKNGHKLLGHYCVYCNQSKEKITTNNPNAIFMCSECNALSCDHQEINPETGKIERII